MPDPLLCSQLCDRRATKNEKVKDLSANQMSFMRQLGKMKYVFNTLPDPMVPFLRHHSEIFDMQHSKVQLLGGTSEKATISHGSGSLINLFHPMPRSRYTHTTE